MLSERTGGPAVRLVKADFTDRIRKKRAYIAKNWHKPRPEKGWPNGVPNDIIQRALAILDDRLANPQQANPYLDMCLWKGRFPSRRAQFCTGHLKVEPIDEFVTRPCLAAGNTVISWQGVRAQESFERSLLPPLQRLAKHDDLPGRFYAYRPILNWTLEEVFAYADRFGVPRNILYGLGLSRVGCFPCINASKREISLVDRVFPEQIARLEAWERLVSEASKRGNSTFFTLVNDPLMSEEVAYEEALTGHKKLPGTYTLEQFGVRRMVEWAKTTRGGRQYDLFPDRPTEAPSCAMQGACE